MEALKAFRLGAPGKGPPAGHVFEQRLAAEYQLSCLEHQGMVEELQDMRRTQDRFETVIALIALGRWLGGEAELAQMIAVRIEIGLVQEILPDFGNLFGRDQRQRTGKSGPEQIIAERSRRGRGCEPPGLRPERRQQPG